MSGAEGELTGFTLLLDIQSVMTGGRGLFTMDLSFKEIDLDLRRVTCGHPLRCPMLIGF